MTGPPLGQERTGVRDEDLAWEDPAPWRAGAVGDVPVLRVEGYEGPLDWWLEQAQARRIDLARLPILALVEQCVAALDDALAARDGAGRPRVPLQQAGDWLVMAARLALLRSHLLLPPEAEDARAARHEAEALRGHLVERARLRAAVAWLDARPQLGRDVFARGMPRSDEGPAPGHDPARVADLTALLRACLVALAMPGGQEAFRPAAPAPWSIQDALARVRRLLGERPDGAAFARFLPPIAPEAPDRDLRCRNAVASTLSAGLEMARTGEADLHQDEAFGDIHLRGVPGTASTGTTRGGTGDGGRLPHTYL